MAKAETAFFVVLVAGGFVAFFYSTYKRSQTAENGIETRTLPEPVGNGRDTERNLFEPPNHGENGILTNQRRVRLGGKTKRKSIIKSRKNNRK